MTQHGYANFPRGMRWAALGLLGLCLFVIWDQVHWWLTRDDYSFGFIVPFFVGYVLYERWPTLQRTLREGGLAAEVGHGNHGWMPPMVTAGAWLFLAAGMLLFLFGALYRAAEGTSPTASMPIALGFAVITLAVVYLACDTDVEGRTMFPGRRMALTMTFLFPAAIWLLSAPTFGFVERAVATALLDKVAFVVYHGFDVFGFPLVREGSVLILPRGEVGVEDACSGIRSMTACLFAGSFLGAVFLDRFWKKALLVGCALVLAFVTNLMRSLFLTIWAYRHGADAIDGFIHDATGYAIIGVTVVGLLLLLPIFQFKLEIDPEPQDRSNAV